MSDNKSPWSTDRLASHFQKTNAHLVAAMADANGWKASIDDSSLLVGTLAYFYVWDYETDLLWMCAASTSSLKEMVKDMGQIVAESKADICDALGTCVRTLVKQGGRQDDEQSQQMLSALALSYASTTKTWQLANNLQDGGHFLIICYPGDSQDKATLRPAFVGPQGEREPLPVEFVKETCEMIAAKDKISHPEWIGPVKRRKL